MESVLNNYCVVSGLTSPAARRFNGSTCFAVKPDPENAARVAVVFAYDIGSSDGKYVSLNPANLTLKYGVEVRRSSIASPLAGNGVYATKDYKRGEIVLAEKPFVVFPGSSLTDAARRMLERLSQPDREALEGLVSRPSAFADAWASRLNLNVVGDNVGNSALYPLVCRINHACPSAGCNVWWYSEDASKDACALTASRDIKAGEELFANYREASFERSQRVRGLAHYGIVGCDCALCAPTNATAQALSAVETALLPIENLSSHSGVTVSPALMSDALVTRDNATALAAIQRVEAALADSGKVDPIVCSLIAHELNSARLRATMEAFAALLNNAMVGQQGVERVVSLFGLFKSAAEELLAHHLTLVEGNVKHPHYVANKTHFNNNVAALSGPVASYRRKRGNSG